MGGSQFVKKAIDRPKGIRTFKNAAESDLRNRPNYYC